MKVSIVIPCYNEKDTMKKIVEAVPNTPLTYREIIVVDDCSEDRTQTLLRDKLSHVIDRVIYHSVNRGTSPAPAPMRGEFASWSQSLEGAH